MSEQDLVCVLTTIQAPTASVVGLAETLERFSAELVVIGDAKGPDGSEFAVGEFIGIEKQRHLPFRLALHLPENHYTRKNLGYLVAIARGAASIYETDDDNMPLPGWKPRNLRVRARPIKARRWVNVYRLFSPETLIWPRGFPLDFISDPAVCSYEALPSVEIDAPIQQGLANGSPDVDAIWRLLLEEEHTFGREGEKGFWLPPGTWSPFNSQSTWWWPAAYPLLYLPSFCTFRMTDIWRSFVAQRCLWELGAGMVFHGAEVAQQRNQHDLMRDFRDEIPGYLGNGRFCETLDRLRLKAGPDAVEENLRTCYGALVESEFFPEAELVLVDSWLADIAAVRSQ